VVCWLFWTILRFWWWADSSSYMLLTVLTLVKNSFFLRWNLWCIVCSGVFTVCGIIDAILYHSHRAIKKKMELGKLGWWIKYFFCACQKKPQFSRRRSTVVAYALHWRWGIWNHKHFGVWEKFPSTFFTPQSISGRVVLFIWSYSTVGNPNCLWFLYSA